MIPSYWSRHVFTHKKSRSYFRELTCRWESWQLHSFIKSYPNCVNPHTTMSCSLKCYHYSCLTYIGHRDLVFYSTQLLWFFYRTKDVFPYMSMLFSLLFSLISWRYLNTGCKLHPKSQWTVGSLFLRKNICLDNIYIHIYF